MTIAKRALAIALASISPLIGLGLYGVVYDRDNWRGVSVNVALVLVMLLGGPLVSMTNRVALRAAAVGFGLALVIPSVFFLVPEARTLLGRSGLLLFVCPPSIIPMGLDNARLAQAVVTWCYIAFINAALYATVGASLNRLRRNADDDEAIATPDARRPV